MSFFTVSARPSICAVDSTGIYARHACCSKRLAAVGWVPANTRFHAGFLVGGTLKLVVAPCFPIECHWYESSLRPAFVQIRALRRKSSRGSAEVGSRSRISLVMLVPRIIVHGEQVAIRGELFDIGLTGAAYPKLHRLLMEKKILGKQPPEAEFHGLKDLVTSYEQLLRSMGLKIGNSDTNVNLPRLPPAHETRASIGEIGVVGSLLSKKAAELLTDLGYRAYVPNRLENCGSLVWARAKDTDDSKIKPPRLLVALIGANESDTGLFWAKYAVKHRLTMLSIWIHGAEVITGPLFAHGRGPCWNCVRWRLLANGHSPWASRLLECIREAPSQVQIMAEASSYTRSIQTAALGQAINIIASIASKEQRKRLRTQVFIEDIISGNGQYRTIFPLPRCQVCGGSTSGRFPLYSHNENASISDVTLACLLDERTGILRDIDVRQTTTNEPNVPICASIRLSDYVDEYSPGGFEESASGRGTEASSAIQAAVGEAMERYASARYPERAHCKAAAIDITADYLDPSVVGLYSPGQYERPGFPFVPYQGNYPHSWVMGNKLIDGRQILVPSFLCSYGVSMLSTLEKSFCQSTTNGLAAGPSQQYAVQGAVCELVERDALITMWLTQRPPLGRISPDNASPGTFRAIGEAERCNIHLEFYRLDALGDFPCVLAIAVGDGQRWPAVAVGCAANADPKIALEKATYEALASAMSLQRAVERDKNVIPTSATSISRFFDHGLYYYPSDRLKDLDFIRKSTLYIKLSSCQTLESNSPKQWAQRLKVDNVEVIIVDVVSSDIKALGWHVVRAIGTNLQHIHCGYGMERIHSDRVKLALDGAEPNVRPHPMS